MAEDSLRAFTMSVQPWNIVFLVGFAVYIGIRHVFIKRTAGHEKTFRRVDAGKVLPHFVRMHALVPFPVSRLRA
jgi:hypothetical protein